MSNLKYKVGDRFEDNHNDSLEIEILQCVEYDMNPYRVKYSNQFHEDYVCDIIIDKYYTKIEENKMNIEENKHHLLWGDTQSIELIEDFLSKEEYIGFLKGNILKYQLRIGKKDDVAKELKKIQDYTNELNKMLNEKSNN